jgi:hypothetical protein
MSGRKFKPQERGKKASYISAVFSFITNVNRISINEWSKSQRHTAGWSRSQFIDWFGFRRNSNVDIGSTRHKRGNYHVLAESQSAIIDKLTEQHASLENNSLLTAFFFLQNK